MVESTNKSSIQLEQYLVELNSTKKAAILQLHDNDSYVWETAESKIQ